MEEPIRVRRTEKRGPQLDLFHGAFEGAMYGTPEQVGSGNATIMTGDYTTEPQSVILDGDPGAGKTTWAVYVMACYLAKNPQKKGAYFPVLQKTESIVNTLPHGVHQKWDAVKERFEFRDLAEELSLDALSEEELAKNNYIQLIVDSINEEYKGKEGMMVIDHIDVLRRLEAKRLKDQGKELTEDDWYIKVFGLAEGPGKSHFDHTVFIAETARPIGYVPDMWITLFKPGFQRYQKVRKGRGINQHSGMFLYELVDDTMKVAPTSESKGEMSMDEFIRRKIEEVLAGR